MNNPNCTKFSVHAPSGGALLWPCLGPSPTTMQYAMYFWFCRWHGCNERLTADGQSAGGNAGAPKTGWNLLSSTALLT